MGEFDHNGIPTGCIASHEIVSLGTQNGSLILVTAGEVSEERRKILEFVCGQSIRLDSLAAHPELHDTFHGTIAACKAVMAAQPTRISESAEAFLKRLESDPNAHCRCSA